MTQRRYEEFAPIERHQLYENEPAHAQATFVETTGDVDEYLLLTAGDPTDKGYEGSIPLSPMEARRLVEVIGRWLARVTEVQA